MKPSRSSISAALVLASLAAAAPADAAGTTRHVCAGCTYQSIGLAATNAGHGDTIVVAPGTYTENVRLPEGLRDVTIRGAQAGTPGRDYGERQGGETILQSHVAGGTALQVNGNGITVDGLTIRDSGIGIQGNAAYSGLEVRNTVFDRNSTPIVADSSGVLPTIIRDNAFARRRGDVRSIAAIATGNSGGSLLVDGNRIAGPRALLLMFGREASYVWMRGNESIDGDTSLAWLSEASDVLLESNMFNSPDEDAIRLDDTSRVTVRGNVISGARGAAAVRLGASGGGSDGTIIEGNDFSGHGDRVVHAEPQSLDGPMVVRFNRFPVLQSALVNDAAPAVDARYNWWGCNEGPGKGACSAPEAKNGAIDASSWLQLSIAAEPVDASGRASVRASIRRTNTGETLSVPSVFPGAVRFSARWGRLSSNIGELRDGSAVTDVTVDGPDTVSATLDGSTVSTEIPFARPPAAPGPQSGPDGDATPGPTLTPGAGASGSASSCVVTRRRVRCELAGDTAAAARRRGARVALFSGSRRIAAPRRANGQGFVSLRFQRRRFDAGRYVLAVTRRGRTIASETVQIRPRV